MSGIKEYFKEEFDLRTLVLQHPKPAQFYLSAWQTTRSVVPLLIWRTLLFLTSVGIVLSSMIIYIQNGIYGYWFIYLTHWGLTVILFATGFALSVSVRCYFYGPISAEFVLPWYVKTYWVLQNIAVPIAFLITIFYWTILYEAGIEEELSHGLDIAVHGINTLVMFLLLISSSHPTRILHIYQPICFSLCYVAFGLVYYWAGGVNTCVVTLFKDLRDKSWNSNDVIAYAGIEEELSHGLDIAVHGINTLVMFLLLISSSHPTRILHIYQPICFSLCYVAFGLVYYWAGGVNTDGNRWVYPVVNWANPGPTIGVCAITGVLLALLHLLTIGIAVGRDAIARKLVKPSVTANVEEGYPLRRPVQTT